MKKTVKTTCEILIQYYSGDHSKCKSTCIINDTCQGLLGCSWFRSSDYLSGQGVKLLNTTAEDRAIIKRVIDVKLGEQSLEQTHMRTTAQAVEAFNHTTRTVLPKTQAFLRTMFGRVDGGIIFWNNGPKKLAKMKLRGVKCDLPEGSPIWTGLSSSKNG